MTDEVLCPACHKPIKEGTRISKIALGPGDDPVEQAKMAQGLPYNAVVVTIHWDCCDPRIDVFAEGSEKIVRAFKAG